MKQSRDSSLHSISALGGETNIHFGWWFLKLSEPGKTCIVYRIELCYAN